MSEQAKFLKFKKFRQKVFVKVEECFGLLLYVPNQPIHVAIERKFSDKQERQEGRKGASVTTAADSLTAPRTVRAMPGTIQYGNGRLDFQQYIYTLAGWVEHFGLYTVQYSSLFVLPSISINFVIYFLQTKALYCSQV